ncbi:MAG: FG-GAP-like repeat-containing protein [Pirellulaceae bacterium]
MLSAIPTIKFRFIGTWGPCGACVEESSTTLSVQPRCQGRFDAADWDGDGLIDLVTGSFDGEVRWHRNQGTSTEPKFAADEPFGDIRSAYNAHPRWIDFNLDGRLDLLLGNNWGTFSLWLGEANQEGTELSNKPRMLRFTTGETINLRQLNGDDTTPEAVPLTAGTIDLISGGKNGRLFMLEGVGFEDHMKAFESVLDTHGDRWGSAIRDDPEVRQQAFGALAALRADCELELVDEAAKRNIMDRCQGWLQRYPTLLQRRRFDLDSEPHAPLLAAQFWVVLLEMNPESAEHRQRVAQWIGGASGYGALLVDLGILFIDNDTATAEHLDAMHRLLTAIPPTVWDVETITVNGWLGPAAKTHKVQSRSGVNIFDLPLGRPEDSFAADSPRPGVTDVYMICLAHEIAHNMLDTVGRQLRPDLYERKFAGLARGAGPLVVYRSPKSAGIDLSTTQKKFKESGVWNGEDSTWRQAWLDYFKGKVEYDRAYARGNIQFFLDAPQEAFATLANQYFADSELMLEFCKTRWDAGARNNINQFLLIAEYLSEAKDQVPTYTMRPGGGLRIRSASLKRDMKGRIDRIAFDRVIASFEYDQEDLVRDFQLERE